MNEHIIKIDGGYGIKVKHAHKGLYLSRTLYIKDIHHTSTEWWYVDFASTVDGSTMRLSCPTGDSILTINEDAESVDLYEVCGTCLGSGATDVMGFPCHFTDTGAGTCENCHGSGHEPQYEA